jgi:hypothetical protein
MPTIDIFITHAWRPHPAWQQVVSYINDIPDVSWRNFSVPWHDPALHPSTETGFASITRTLKTQILPCDLCIVITSLYALKGNRMWIDLALEYAGEANIPVVFLGDPDGPVIPQVEMSDLRPADFENVKQTVLKYAKN